MGEPVKYLTLVGDMLSLYQQELIRLYRKYPQEIITDFRKAFQVYHQQLKQTEANKAITDELSSLCDQMANHLDAPRPSKTSADHRKNLRSQAGTRGFRMTGDFKRRPQEQPIEEEEELNDIMQSFKLDDLVGPRTRMKWRSGQPQRQDQDGQSATIGSNNIDLLSYAIPEIENSIRRLSLQRSPLSVKDRAMDLSRTLDSRSHKKKYIPRLF